MAQNTSGQEKDLRIAMVLTVTGMLLSVLFVMVSTTFIYPLIFDLAIIVYVFLLPLAKKNVERK
jgi:hypothetical protein